jgi:polysaccharide deacetylase family protein (PEP-CTERM system associated)
VRPDDEPTLANVLTVDVEEYYHGVEFAHALDADALGRLPSRVVRETERLLDALDEHGARGTFFTLGIVARRHPRLVRTIAERGHEIASHGWDHTLIDRLGPEGFRADVRSAKRALEACSGRAVVGYRAPNYSLRGDTPWAYTILEEEGYVYDSSVYPIAHDRYGFPSAPRFPHAVNTANGVIWEVPVGTARLWGRNLPIGGGFFRLVPEALLTEAIASVNRIDQQPVVLYVHPWEFDPDQPRPPMPWMHRFRHYVGLARAERKLRALLRAFRFTSIDGAFEQIRRVRSAPDVYRAAS